MKRFPRALVRFLSLAAAFLSTSVCAETPPNIVVIFIDDMGYADINPFGDARCSTPHLDRMAAEGRRFTDFVVSSAVCSASRSALMTGCYHRRIGISGALGPKSEIGLHEAETTLAEVCQSKGYATAIFGKWHLGHHPKFLPTAHGFDHFYGIPYSNDMWPLHPDFLARREKNPHAKSPWPDLPMISSTREAGYQIVNPKIQPADQEQMTKQFTERAVEFIRTRADQPFFLYLPHPMVHVPLYASDEFKGKSGQGVFGDVVMEVDWSVGQIMSALDSIGAAENTLVIFTSDNGPWLSYGTHAGSAAPLREGKGTMFEGGCRAPTLMWWKGKIPAGTTCDQLCSTIDVLPTVAKLIGAELPLAPLPGSQLPESTRRSLKIDGKDIRPLMFGDEGASSPHEAFYCYYAGGELQAVRNERFKLMFPHRYRTLDGREGGEGGKPTAYQMTEIGLSLFDLDNDVSETTDVKERFPAVVKELQFAAERARQDLGDKLTRRKGSGLRASGKLEAGDERLPLQW
ncbi:Arylsulfatase [Novipirellula galeiformis]|uniref:Arylsulfatase n=1 Tax=Novipirellula galeiformis TaxID=2528004 RepID=A0A5C6CFS0_9BACT|nr:sulfatase [Novipirellula galeiformis]TWU22096.1 Arylsulfatase [Novipirellula galeiformis]